MVVSTENAQSTGSNAGFSDLLVTTDKNIAVFKRRINKVNICSTEGIVYFNELNNTDESILMLVTDKIVYKR